MKTKMTIVGARGTCTTAFPDIINSICCETMAERIGELSWRLSRDNFRSDDWKLVFTESNHEMMYCSKCGAIVEITTEVRYEE